MLKDARGERFEKMQQSRFLLFPFFPKGLFSYPGCALGTTLISARYLVTPGGFPPQGHGEKCPARERLGAGSPAVTKIDRW
jgi:hypothetical protein